MMGSFLTRGIIMVCGYTYPAYECYKIVEKNRPDVEQLKFWCQYWIIVAILTVLERVGDTFVSWVPMYSEAKLAFFIYLWYPKTKGTTYVYQTFLKPYVARHETDIDRNLLELRTRMGDMTVVYWQKVSVYAQARFFELLQYIASHSSSPQPVQNTQWQPQTVQANPAGLASQGLPNSGNTQPQLPVTAQPKGSGQSAKPQKPVQSAAVSSGSNWHPSTSESDEEMEVDLVDLETEEEEAHRQEHIIERPVRMTRSRLRNTHGPL